MTLTLSWWLLSEDKKAKQQNWTTLVYKNSAGSHPTTQTNTHDAGVHYGSRPDIWALKYALLKTNCQVIQKCWKSFFSFLKNVWSSFQTFNRSNDPTGYIYLTMKWCSRKTLTHTLKKTFLNFAAGRPCELLSLSPHTVRFKAHRRS